MIADKIEAFYVRGAVDEPLPQNQDDSLFYYEVRHQKGDENEPMVLEMFVLNNYYATVGFKEPLHLDHDDYIELDEQDRLVMQTLKRVVC